MFLCINVNTIAGKPTNNENVEILPTIIAVKSIAFSLGFYCTLFYFLCQSIFQLILGQMAHNVSAVYDVLAARISKCVAFAGPTKCGWRLAWE
jgi:hypothetical protein